MPCLYHELCVDRPVFRYQLTLYPWIGIAAENKPDLEVFLIKHGVIIFKEIEAQNPYLHRGMSHYLETAYVALLGF